MTNICSYHSSTDGKRKHSTLSSWRDSQIEQTTKNKILFQTATPSFFHLKTTGENGALTVTQSLSEYSVSRSKSPSNLSDLQVQGCPGCIDFVCSARRNSVRLNQVGRRQGEGWFFPFSYTLVLTYNLWRGYALSTFFEYIFLFLQGKERASRRTIDRVCSRRSVATLGPVEVLDQDKQWSRQIKRAIHASLWNTRVTKTLSRIHWISSLFFSRFCSYLFLSLCGLIPAAWMRLCTVRTRSCPRLIDCLIDLFARSSSFQSVPRRRSFNCEPFWQTRVRDKSVDLAGWSLRTTTSVSFPDRANSFSIDAFSL